MDGNKPDDDLKPDPSDRPSGRPRQNTTGYDKEPSLNIDDVDIEVEARAEAEADERRPTSAGRAREQEPFVAQDEEDRPRRRRPPAANKPSVSRQHIMLGVGILVLLLIIFGIGSALKGPSSNVNAGANNASSERNINLSGGSMTQENTVTNASPDASAQSGGDARDISLPPISSTPTQSLPAQTQDGQQRMEIQGDLNNALTPPQDGQVQMGDTASSTLPTQPATVAGIGNGGSREPQASRPAQVTEPRRPPRQTTVIEAPHKQPQRQAPAKSEPKPAVKAPTQTASTPAKAPVATSTPKAAESKPAAASAGTTTSSSAAKASTGNVGALTSASPSHYTLQLSSSSNYANLNAWAKKEKLQDYVVYQTQREGKPWFVLVKGVYASKDEAKRAVSSLPADVQAKNPWTKPISQVQSDLK